MLEVKDGKIFVNGKETQDHEFIGLAFMDFAEQISKKIICNDPVKIVGEDWSSENYIGQYIRYDQDYADKQREADEIVNDIEDSF